MIRISVKDEKGNEVIHLLLSGLEDFAYKLKEGYSIYIESEEDD